MKHKLAPIVENVAESATACLLTMVQGNVLALTVAHWLIASRTGIVAGLIAWVAIVLAGTKSRWMVSVVLGTVTAVVDYLTHPGQFGPAAMEAAVTVLAAAALSFLVGVVVRRARKTRSPDDSSSGLAARP